MNRIELVKAIQPHGDGDAFDWKDVLYVKEVTTCVTGIRFTYEGIDRTVPLSNVRMISYGVSP